MDALGSQKDIAAQIVDGGGDDVLAIRDNHPTLHKGMSEHFDQVHEEGCIETGVRNHQTSDAKHGRVENRYYYQASIPESLKELTDFWKGATSIAQVHNITIRDGKECCEIRYHLSSLPVSVTKFASAVPAHWGIENSFHWVWEVTFNEDQSGIRKCHSPYNFALFRRFAIYILSLDTSIKSTWNKQKRAAWDENYLLYCLAAINKDVVARPWWPGRDRLERTPCVSQVNRRLRSHHPRVPWTTGTQ